MLLSVLVLVLGVPAVALSTAAPASGAVQVATDENGANDEPNQKDLTRFTVDYATAPSGYLDVTFNWDDIDWSGENTGDGCFLFDSDGDLKANAAVCVTVNGSPASITSTTIYTCGDARVDRCSSPVTTVSPSIGSVTACTVAQSNDDPFPAGSAYPLDTKASCTIDLDDVGGTTTAILTNTCSYPSAQPNSDPSDCVLIPRDGILRIVKVADPDDGTPFHFTLDDNDGVADPESLGPIEGSGSLDVPVTSTKTYTVAEDESLLPAGWELTGASCDNGETPTSLDVEPAETVTCTFTNDFDLEPTATLTKTADPTSVAEPGGEVTWTVGIDNTSPEEETIYLTALVDTMFGGGAGFGDLLDWDDPDNTCFNAPATDSVAVPFDGTAAPDFTCTFAGDVLGEPGDSHRNVVTATLDDGDGNTITPSDDATVTVTNVDPTIEVTKDATPSELDEPGGEVTFDVIVENESTFETLTLESLTDDVYGDLLAWNDPDNTCYDSTPLSKSTIAPGATFTCSFKADVTGDAGTVHTNIVTATARDNDPGSTTATDSDSALVTIGDVDPVVTTVKAADPTAVYEPGGLVTYSVTVSNTSTFEAVTLKSLVDTLVSGTAGGAFGDLLDPDNDLDGNTCNDPWEADASAVVTIDASSAYACTFTAPVEGNAGEWHTNRVTGTVVDDGEDIVAPSDPVRVDVLDVLPDITVLKTADRETVPETGEDVTYTVRVTNNETAESLTLTSLADDSFGDSSPVGDLLGWDAVGNTCDEMSTTIPAGGFVECEFVGHVTGNAGTSHTNTVTGTAADDDGNTDTDEDSATVRVLDVAPDVEVDKAADPGSVPETGGEVTYTVDITNNSAEDVWLTDLVDDRFGDILDPTNDAVNETTCVVGTLIEPSDTYTCTFQADVMGQPGFHDNVVTGTVEDDEGTTDSDTGEARVTITDVLPTITVTKSAPATINEPGGVITYSVSVQNTSFEPVTLTALVDDRFGDLLDDAGNALISGSTCESTTIGFGGIYSCTFQASVTGNAGFSHTNVATATAVDDDRSEATDSDDATVTLLDVPPTIELTKTADVASVDAPGGEVTYTVTVENTSTEEVALTDLVDDRFGDILDADNPLVLETTCVDESVIAVGETYTCTFTAFVEGLGGAHVNVVAGTAVDDDGTEVMGTARERVVINEVLGEEEERPRPPVVLPETGAPRGLGEVLGMGMLVLLMGIWVLARSRRRTA